MEPAEEAQQALNEPHQQACCRREAENRTFHRMLWNTVQSFETIAKEAAGRVAALHSWACGSEVGQWWLGRSNAGGVHSTSRSDRRRILFHCIWHMHIRSQRSYAFRPSQSTLGVPDETGDIRRRWQAAVHTGLWVANMICGLASAVCKQNES
jgi:hypothetical protein